MLFRIFLFLIFGVFSPSWATVEGVDAIYLINLDRRPDRLEAAMAELAKYDLYPRRFSAIEGKQSDLNTLLELGLPYKRNMLSHRWATTPLKNGTIEFTFLDSSAENKSIFSEWMTIGALGCALSHLNVLKEAYEAGYETIWVLEDDICCKKDPHLLSQLIRDLDTLTEGKWDILYTDLERFGGNSYPPESFWWMWRPDIALYNIEAFAERKFISKDLIELGSRERTHSMIVRRSGMKKVLDHIKDHHLYLPIDHEIAFAPDIRLFMTAYPIVTFRDSSSDIQQKESLSIYGTSEWEVYKKTHLHRLSQFPGWCTETKANRLMDFIYEHKPKVCVEIGTFGGSTTFPLLWSVKYLNQGHVFAIDAWKNKQAIFGLNPQDSNYLWWKQLDLHQIKNRFLSELKQLHLQSRCTVIDTISSLAAASFQDDSIDFLYLDGNFSEEGSLQDVVTYWPKVKKGGYIWLNDANSPAKIPSVAFLHEHAVFLPEESLKNTCVVFKKQ